MEYTRVHDDVTILRRNLQKSFANAKPFLVEDFHDMCGYCGKHFNEIGAQSQVDHFIPAKKYPQLANEYSNFVLCCRVCNRKKWDDWPSGSVESCVTADGLKGYVDPCSEEFDHHLVRNSDGDIIGLTDVGKYMVSKLSFDTRPIKEVFKVHKLCNIIKKLKLKRDNDSHLADLLLELDDLRGLLYYKKEN